MSWLKMQISSLYLHSIFCLAMAMMFAIAGMNLTPGNAAIPVSLAFTAMAMLGTSIEREFTKQRERIKELEAEVKAMRGQLISEPIVS